MLKRLKLKSEFTKNVLTLMTGSTIAQAIPIAISPILTRIYSPEDFGVLALYMSVAVFVSTAATGKYELAIMLPRKDSDAFNIVWLSILITFFIASIILIAVSIFNVKIASLLGHPEIAYLLYLLPISVLLTGLYQSLNFWMTRKKQFKNVSISRIVQSATGSASNLGLGFMGFGGIGLIVSGMTGQFIGTLFLAKVTLKEDSKYINSINRIKSLAMIKKYKKLPLITLPNSLIDSFRLSGISILIARYFSTATLGQFSLAWKMVQMPMGLIGAAIAQVFFQKLSSSNKSEFYYIIIQFLRKASLISAPVFLLLYFFSVEIFEFVFGDQWVLAGEAASTMTLWLFLNFMTSPLSIIYVILNKQEILFMFAIVYMVVPLGIILLFHNQSFIYVLSLVSYSMSILLVLFIIGTLSIIKKIKQEV